MTTQLDLNNYRISLTEAGLAVGWFRDLNIPRPKNCDYKDFSQLAGQSTGGQVRQGYARAVLSWDKLTRFHVYLLETYQRAMTSTSLLYLTIDRVDGYYPGSSWVNVSCKPQVITYTPEENVKDKVLTGVVWTLNNVLVLGALY